MTAEEARALTRSVDTERTARVEHMVAVFERTIKQAAAAERSEALIDLSVFVSALVDPRVLDPAMRRIEQDGYDVQLIAERCPGGQRELRISWAEDGAFQTHSGAA